MNNKQRVRKTNRIVRMPASKSPHLRKKMQKIKAGFHSKSQGRKEK